MSKRPLQLASIIHRAVQSVLGEGLSDPRLADALVTITRVKVSQDLHSSTIFVSIMPEKAQSRAIHALNDAAGYIRRSAAERVALHRMPDLLFKLDKAIKRQAGVLAALDRVERERRASDENERDPATPAPPDTTPNDGDHP